MNSDVKTKWLAALRSGEYKQGKRQLKKGDEFCCLGVLCDLYAKEKKEVWIQKEQEYYFLDSKCLLPVEVIAWAGLKDVLGTYSQGDSRSCLPRHNDNGKTFNEIAQIIEKKF